MPSAAWDRVVYDLAQGGPDPGTLTRLGRGEHAVVVVKNLLPAESFEINRKRLAGLFGYASTATYVNGALTTIGPYLARCLDRPHEYFAAAAAARELLVGAGFDLDTQVRSALAATLGLASIEPAREPDGRRYADCVIRIHADGVRNPLHNDNIMRDAAGTGLVLAGLDTQLSCVVCLQECDAGGELAIYGRSWQRTDEQFKVAGWLGYDEAVVAGAPVHMFKPQAGDVYLINPTYYHAIEQVSGSTRLTMGFFMGLRTDAPASAVVWG
jgi:hypothetical protein